MLSFEEYLEESAFKTKAWHYTKAIARNVITPHYAAARRMHSQRNIDRYKMHKRIANDTTNSAEVRQKSREKMKMHMATIKKSMEAD